MLWQNHILTARRLLILTACFVTACNRNDNVKAAHQELVVYSSVDDSYSRPLCERFSQATKIEVKLVPDAEETKSTGLLNRLIAEKKRPQADLFWSGDPVRAAVLEAKGICAPYNSPQAPAWSGQLGDAQRPFTTFSARMRVIIFNRNLLAGKEPPNSIFDLTHPRFRGNSCLANPLFGTTSMHAAALFHVLGNERARAYFRALTENQVRMLSSNGEVRRRVSAGEFAMGLTDSDDVSVAVKDGAPIEFVLPDQEGIGTLLVPNAVVLIAGGPHPENAKKFIDFLLSPESERWLAESEAAQIPLREGMRLPKLFSSKPALADIRLMKVEYGALAMRLEELNRGFLEDWVQQQNNLPRHPHADN
jgi:iron(III) transport system substrate-binding protein